MVMEHDPLCRYMDNGDPRCDCDVLAQARAEERMKSEVEWNSACLVSEQISYESGRRDAMETIMTHLSANGVPFGMADLWQAVNGGERYG